MTTRHHVTTWLPATACTILIFLTLPYLPSVFTALQGRFGRPIVSATINLCLIAIAAFLIGYLALRKKERRKSAYLSLAGLLTSYGYFIYRLPIPTERIHLAEYGLLAHLIHRGLWKEGIRGSQSYVVAVTATYLIGMADEAVQYVLPNRVGEFRDVLINGLCGALALWLTAIVEPPTLGPEGAGSHCWSFVWRAAAVSVAASVLFLKLVGL